MARHGISWFRLSAALRYVAVAGGHVRIVRQPALEFSRRDTLQLVGLLVGGMARVVLPACGHEIPDELGALVSASTR